MDPETLKVVGQVAGIGGVALAVLLFVFREVIRKNIFPNLDKDQAYRIIRLIITFTFLIAMIGVGGWIYLQANGLNPEEFARVKPQLRSPDDGAEFGYHNGRALNLVWEAIPHAVAYRVETEFQEDGPIPHSIQWTPLDTKNVSQNELQIDFIGATLGRWRVSAVNNVGLESQKSDWRTFRFTR